MVKTKLSRRVINNGQGCPDIKVEAGIKHPMLSPFCPLFSAK